MKDHLKKPVEIAIAGNTYLLVWDFNSLATAEEITGRQLHPMMAQKDYAAPKINFVRALFFAMLHKEQPHLSYEAAKALVTQDTFVVVWTSSLEALTRGLAAPDSNEAESDYPTPGSN